jgi:hypothetical protein
MTTDSRIETGKVWACQLFSWVELEELQGILALWSDEPLLTGKYVELEGTINIDDLPLPVIRDIGTRIDQEHKFLDWAEGAKGAEKEDWMETYASQRLCNCLDILFEIKEVDIIKDDLVFTFGNLSCNAGNRPASLLFLAEDDATARKLFDSLTLQQRFDQGIIAFDVLTNATTGDITGLKLSAVWQVRGAGGLIGKPEYYFDVRLEYKSTTQEAAAYRLSGRSQKSEAGLIEIKCYLAFIYWNSFQGKNMGLPEGIKVQALDYDLVSGNDIIGRGEIIGSKGHVRIDAVNKGEGRPNVFFEVLTDAKYIELETNRFVAKDQQLSDKHYLLLPKKWSSKDRYATNKTLGYKRDFDGSSIGGPRTPLAFWIDQ